MYKLAQARVCLWFFSEDVNCFDRTRHQLLETIKEYKPLSQIDIQHAKILLLGHVNVGKSSFFNTINSIFRNHVTAQAPVGSPRDQRSVTTKVGPLIIVENPQGLRLCLEHNETDKFSYAILATTHYSLKGTTVWFHVYE